MPLDCLSFECIQEEAVTGHWILQEATRTGSTKLCLLNNTAGIGGNDNWKGFALI